MVEIDLEAVEHELRTREDPVAIADDLALAVEREAAEEWIDQAVMALERSGTVETLRVGDDLVVWHHDRVTPPLA